MYAQSNDAEPEVPSSRLNVQVPRAGEIVATRLRKMILNGELLDGERLPRQEDLLPRFGVSHPSLREGLRILETEGLIAIRRGKFGGAVVRRPKEGSVAYSIGLVLQADGVRVKDLATALDELEPTCFALISTRPDRDDVMDVLDASCDRLERIGARQPGFTAAAREFHQLAVEHCGNSTVRVAVGSLTRLWTLHEERVVGGVASTGQDVSAADRLAVLATHRRLCKLMRGGKVDEVRSLARRHLTEAQHYVFDRSEDVPLDVSNLPLTMRSRL